MWRRAGALVALAGMFASAAAHAEIRSARYAEPTTRYAHGVLGDAVEYGALELRLSDGARRILRLPEARVFEDLIPRVMDLDGDDAPEVVVIESHRDQGARLAVYGETGLITATPYIGRTHRWLAPLGAADLDGDGAMELAYIDRPHLAKTLRIWRYQDRQLSHVADLAGLTNHRIGEDFISGGIRSCGATPEIIMANATWSRIMSVTLSNGTLRARNIGPFTKAGLAQQSRTCP